MSLYNLIVKSVMHLKKLFTYNEIAKTTIEGCAILSL